MYPWNLTIAIAVMFYGFIALMFVQSGKKLGREALFYYPDISIKLLPTMLFGTYLVYSYNAGGIDWKVAWSVLGYLLIPVLLLWPAREAGNKLTGWDVAAIAFLWLPFDLHLVGKRPNAIKDALDWPCLDA